MLRIVVIDTCGQDGSVVLAEVGEGRPRVVGTAVLPGRTASERLMPEIEAMMTRVGWRFEEIGGVGVVNGPGSFTGVRVGLSAAKGLSEAGAVPMVAVSRLEVLARKATDAGETVHAVLDAGRGEFFYGRVDRGQAMGEALLDREGVVRMVAGGGVLAVSDAAGIAAFEEMAVVVVSPLTAADAVPLVAERMEAGEFADVETLDANYLRRTEAEVLERLAARQAGR